MRKRKKQRKTKILLRQLMDQIRRSRVATGREVWLATSTRTLAIGSEDKPTALRHMRLNFVLSPDFIHCTVVCRRLLSPGR